MTNVYSTDFLLPSHYTPSVTNFDELSFSLAHISHDPPLTNLPINANGLLTTQ